MPLSHNNVGALIDTLVEMAQLARKNGLLALEEKANEIEDMFFRQGIMLIVDATVSIISSAVSFTILNFPFIITIFDSGINSTMLSEVRCRQLLQVILSAN